MPNQWISVGGGLSADRPADSGKRVRALKFFESLKQMTTSLRSRGAEKVLRGTERHLGGAEKEQKEQLTRRIASLVLMAGVTVGSFVTAQAIAPKAVVTVDGKVLPAVTISSSDTGKILKDAGAKVGAHDLVVSTIDRSSGGMNIVVRTAEHVSVTADGKTKSALMHWGDSVSSAVQQSGVVLGANDTVSAPRSGAVRDGMNVAVTRCYQVGITADGKKAEAVVRKGAFETDLSVERALSQSGVVLGAEDVVAPGKDTAVEDGISITVQRVGYRDVTTTEPVAYQTKTVEDAGSLSGTKTVTTAGQNGVKTTVTREKTMDGQTVSSEVVSSSVTTQPVDEVVSVGTRRPAAAAAVAAPVRTGSTIVDGNGRTVSYRKVLTGRCTSYSGGGGTASGRPLRRGAIAVNPNIIPYGTQLYICSPDGQTVYGYAVASDTGTAAMDGRILADLYYSTLNECIQFGARTMNLYILN